MDYAILAVVILVLGMLFYLADNMRRIRIVLEAQTPDWFLLTSRNVHFSGGFSVWSFRDRGWTLEKSNCAPGYEPGEPPQGNGAYDGQCIRKKCVRSTAN